VHAAEGACCSVRRWAAESLCLVLVNALCLSVVLVNLF
jgi:hypothetical protein